MKNINKIRRNMIIFIAFVTLCGWIGYLVDKSTGQANYENIGTMQNQGTLGLLIWLVSPLICTIILRFFSKDGWKNSGFAPNIKNNKKFYLISFLIYPVVTVAVILLGLVTKGIKINDINMGILGYIWILLTQIAIQFVKNIFEESVWRGYFTNQLLKFNLSDIKLYLLVGFVWWVWHLPYIMIFLTESEIQNTLPVGRLTFLIIGMVVVTCWSVMYTEIFRITKSIWPLVIAHTMEDAVINPLLLYGIVNVDKSHSFLFSLSVGIIPTFFYLMIGLSIRRWRKNQGNI